MQLFFLLRETYSVVFGGNPIDDKRQEGDSRQTLGKNIKKQKKKVR